jgi:hypothetical protein
MNSAALTSRSKSRKRWSIAVLVAIGVICLLLFSPYFFPTVRINQQWVESSYSIKLIALAIQNYHEVNGQLPPAVVRDKDGRPLYSWRVALLPYLEHDSLYLQFRLDEPWDSPHNEPLSRTTPRCYAPARGDDPDGLTRYQVLVGPGTAFEKGGLTWADFPDGREHTLLVVEAGQPVPWAKPVDVGYDPAGPLPSLGAGYTKPIHFLRREIRRNPGFAVCFADGTTRFIRSPPDETLLRAVTTRNGGERVNLSQLE